MLTVCGAIRGRWLYLPWCFTYTSDLLFAFFITVHEESVVCDSLVSSIHQFVFSTLMADSSLFVTILKLYPFYVTKKIVLFFLVRIWKWGLMYTSFIWCGANPRRRRSYIPTHACKSVRYYLAWGLQQNLVLILYEKLVSNMNFWIIAEILTLD